MNEVVAVIAGTFSRGAGWLDYDIEATRKAENEWEFAGLRWKVFTTEDSLRGYRFWDAVYLGPFPGQRPTLYEIAPLIVERYRAKPR